MAERSCSSECTGVPAARDGGGEREREVARSIGARGVDGIVARWGWAAHCLSHFRYSTMAANGRINVPCITVTCKHASHIKGASFAKLTIQFHCTSFNRLTRPSNQMQALLKSRDSFSSYTRYSSPRFSQSSTRDALRLHTTRQGPVRTWSAAWNAL